MYLVLVIVFLLSVLVFGVWDSIKSTKCPPGPQCVPFLGSLLLLKSLVSRTTLYEALQRLADRYGHVFMFRLARAPPTVYIKGDAILDVLSREELNGRACTFYTQFRTMGLQRGITYGNGLKWKHQKEFVEKQLNELKSSETFIEVIKSESKKLAVDLKRNSSTACIQASVLRILRYITLGVDVHNDIQPFLELLKKATTMEENLTETVHHSSWLQYLSSDWSGYKTLAASYTPLWTHVSERLYEAKMAACHDPTCLLDYMVLEMRKTPCPGVFSDQDIVACCLDVLMAGVKPMTDFLGAVIKVLDQHPRIKVKIKKEIDQQTSSLKPNQLYLTATLLEVLRLTPVAPLSKLHVAECQSSLNGYTLPKGSQIILDLASLNKDEQHWTCPNVFEPKRFLNNLGEVKDLKHFIPFGAGSRKCAGGNLSLYVTQELVTGILENLPP